MSDEKQATVVVKAESKSNEQAAAAKPLPVLTTKVNPKVNSAAPVAVLMSSSSEAARVLSGSAPAVPHPPANAETKELPLEELEAAIQKIADKAIQTPQLETLVYVYTKLEPYVQVLRDRHGKVTDSRVVQLHNSLVVFMLELRNRMQMMIPLSTYYRLDKVLRECIAGKVYLATDTRTNRIAAVKLLSWDELKRKGQTDNVERELHIMKAVSDMQAKEECHHVIRMYDSFQEGDKVFIAMEYCANGELYNRVCRKRLPESEARRFFRQILLGLHYVHRAGFAHLDISPENVLLDSNDVAKVIDFGLSAPLDRCPPGARGKVRYMAPEVFSGQKYDPIAADVYSCGITLFVMLTAALPYRTPNRMDGNFKLLFEGHINRFFQANPLIHQPSKTACDMLSRMLLHQGARPSLQQLLQHEWFAQKD